MRIATISVACLISVCLAPPICSAQDRLVRISANLGLQEPAGSLALDMPVTSPGGSGFFRIDDRFSTSDIYDASVAVRIWKRISLGGGLSRTRTERLGHPYTASVPPPSPGLLNIPSSGVAGGLAHSERNAYALIAWTAPVSNRFDVVVSGGPAFLELEQDLPELSTVTGPLGGTLLVIRRGSVTESTTGFHVGVDFDYVFGRRAGGGVLVRYARGSVDVPFGTRSATIGGLQFTAGLRLKL